MATRPTTSEILLNEHVRNFIQWNGSKPANSPKFSGLDAQYMMVSGVERPEAGDISPIYVHDPRRAGKYRQIARTTSPADLPSATISFYEKLRGVARHLIQIGCFTLYDVIGDCTDLSSFTSGASAYTLIYSEGTVTSKSFGDRSTAGDTDNPLTTEIGATFVDIYPAGTIGFGEVAAVDITREAIDLVYANKGGCVNCDTSDIYTSWLYVVTASSGGSPGMPAEVVYTTDGGLTWQSTNITGMGANEDPVFVDVYGDKLIVGSKTAGGATTGGYYYASINANTGALGTWTKVSTGFVAAKQPNDIYIDGKTFYICGDGGYIYKSDDITTGVTVLNAGSATTNNLLRIHGYEDHIVSVGAASTIIRSINRGITWSATTTTVSLVALDIAALYVMDREYYWVGTSNSGRLFYTVTGGDLWVQKVHPGTGIGNIRDILGATSECIHFAYGNGTTATLYTSVDAGVDFVSSADSAQKRIANWPVFTRANRLAVPQGPDRGTVANYLAVAGLSGGGTDGIALIGLASIS
jgi:photosystem II stability/assembly factor-like uncharacterized protein